MIKGWHHRTRGVSLPTLSNLMTSAIIVAAGGSRRMGFNKLLASLAGAPVLHRTLGEFQACDDIAEIVLFAAMRPAHVDLPEIIVMPVDQASVYHVHRG